MARRKQSRGNCVFCNRELTRGGLTRHLKSCPKRMEAMAEADRARGRNQTLYRMLVQDAWSGYYWLHLEMHGNATLQDLDDYLRAIWLECCGHLSAFEIGPIHYTQVFDDGLGYRVEKPMDVQVRRLFYPGLSVPYEYDFGTTSELTIKVVDERQGKPLSPHPIYLMARNYPPEATCMECDQPATFVCIECMYEQPDGDCELCDEHAEVHTCSDYGGPMPLVNSPRVGMCGYEGPAEPPY